MDRPGHKWQTVGVVDNGLSRFFRYKCSKCKFETLNGEPLPKPFNAKCGDS